MLKDDVQKHIALYDPNALNPYGVELAAVLADDGHSVTRWCRVGDPFADKGIRQRRVLWASRSQVGTLRSLFSRHWGALVFLAHQTMRRDDLIIMTWLQSRMDLRIALTLVRLGRRVIYIDHNPLPARPLPPSRERMMDQMRESRAVRVLHSQYLREQVGDDTCAVARHPSYRRWVKKYSAAAKGNSAGQALFLGGLRKDKGVDDLLPLGKALRAADMRLVIAGRGTIPGLSAEEMQSRSEFDADGSNRSLSDIEVAAHLRQSRVLLAPYRDVTMSGSIMMAVSAGVPVAAYASEALTSTLPSEFFIEDDNPHGLAALAKQLADSPEYWNERLAELIDESDRECAVNWREILQRAIAD